YEGVAGVGVVWEHVGDYGYAVGTGTRYAIRIRARRKGAYGEVCEWKAWRHDCGEAYDGREFVPVPPHSVLLDFSPGRWRDGRAPTNQDGRRAGARRRNEARGRRPCSDRHGTSAPCAL